MAEQKQETKLYPRTPGTLYEIVSVFFNEYGEKFELLRADTGGYYLTGDETGGMIIPLLVPVMSGYILGWAEMAWLAGAITKRMARSLY